MISSSLLALGIEALKALLLDVFHEKGKNIISKVDIDISLQNLDHEISSYVEEYLRRHGQIKILSMRKPVNLEGVYTDAELLLGPQDFMNFDSAEELHEEYLEVGNLLSINRNRFERSSALEFVSEYPRLVILGGPGSGKSTLLKKVGIEAWKRSAKIDDSRQLLPIFIELKNLSKIKNFDLNQEIIREIRICGLKINTEKLINLLLEKGRILLLLDGLDELPQAKRVEVIEVIQNFADEYRQNDFLVSCRLAAYQHKRLENFYDVEIACFEDNQIHEAIRNWFPDRPDVGIDCWQKINLPVNSDVKKLANRPLLLILTCMFYEQRRRFPKNKSTLYEKVISVLLEDWNLSKGSPDRYEDEELDIGQKEIILGSIAYEAFQEERLFMSQRWMISRVEELLEDIDVDSNLRGDKVVRTIELDNGLLVKQADQIYSFSHDTLQEFFVALHVTVSFSRLQKTIENHLLEPRWQGVFVFSSGLRQSSEDVISEIEKKAQSFIESGSFDWLLAWGTKATITSTGSLLPVVRRIFALHVGLCLHLYFSDTTQRFKESIAAVRMCQSLMKEFSAEIPKELNKDIREFEKLIAVLITTRQNTNAYNSSSKSLSGNEVKVTNMRRQVSLICRQCEAATSTAWQKWRYPLEPSLRFR
ncbi:MAG: NACHT domain-containing protein [Cyanobacteria bacterium P01_D01_bin.6]